MDKSAYTKFLVSISILLDCVRASNDSGKVQQLGRVERKLEELWKGLQRNRALTRDCEKEVAELRDEKESCVQRLSTIEQDIEMVSLYALHVNVRFVVWVWYMIHVYMVSISDPYVHTHMLWTSPFPPVTHNQAQTCSCVVGC